jgi:hypothetical protein
MSAAFAPSWPGSRVLLGWWRELLGRHPRQMRLARLLLHRVEALVRVRRSRSLDRWQHALLHLASTRLPCGELISTLSDLQIDVQVLGQLVRELTAHGLLHRNGAGQWHLTAAGQRALASGAVGDSVEERRTFVFADNSPLNLPPCFLPLERLLPHPLSSPAPEPECSFALSHLEACIQQSAAWKARHRFPADVEAWLPPNADWRRVVVDAVTPQWFVFCDTASAKDRSSLLGFAVRPEDWALAPKPLLTLADDARETMPDLFHDPSAESWRQSWRAWSHPRGLSPADVEACRLERIEHRLLVHAPPRVLERLRSTRSDAIKNEAWLLAGEGRARTAAQIELHPL